MLTWYVEYMHIIDLLLDRPILLAWSVAIPNVARNEERRARSGAPSPATVYKKEKKIQLFCRPFKLNHL